MRQLKITKADFDEVVYPLIATHQARKGVDELRKCIRVLDALDQLSEPDQEGVYYRKATAPEPVIELEDADAEYLAELVEGGIGRMGAARARTMLPWLDVLRGKVPAQPATRPSSTPTEG